METEISDLIYRLSRITRGHEEWRRRRCINLIPSENVMSGSARLLLASDFGHRYSSPDHFYMGSSFTDELQGFAEELACKVFRCKYADVRPLSGHICDMAVLMLRCRKGDKIASVSPEDGGYPGISHLGLGQLLGLKSVYFPYDKNKINIDPDRSVNLVRSKKPVLLMFGASMIPFPHPVGRVAKAAPGALKVYDGSHVLGLIAGGRFQDPLREGCDLLIGSTHKSFFGPQGGLIMSNNSEVFNTIHDGIYPGIVDNIHWNRVAALACSLIEIRRFASEYSGQVIRNAQALGKGLHDRRIPVRGKDRGFTQSHQILLAIDDPEVKLRVAQKLEKVGIIADRGIRLGTGEVTRMGMKEEQMDTIAELIADLLHGGAPTQIVKNRVTALVKEHQIPVFCLDA